jgi:hypothetical protein
MAGSPASIAPLHHAAAHDTAKETLASVAASPTDPDRHREGDGTG